MVTPVSRTHFPSCHLLSPLPLCPGAGPILGICQLVPLHFPMWCALDCWRSMFQSWLCDSLRRLSFGFSRPQNGYILIQSSSESESVGWRVFSRSFFQLWQHGRGWVWVFKTSLPLIYCGALGQSLNLSLSVYICNRRTMTTISWTWEDNSNDIRRHYWELAGCHGLCGALSMNSSTSFSEQLGEVSEGSLSVFYR